VPKVLADLVDSDSEFQTVGAATANDRSAKEVVSGGAKEVVSGGKIVSHIHPT